MLLNNIIICQKQCLPLINTINFKVSNSPNSLEYLRLPAIGLEIYYNTQQIMLHLCTCVHVTMVLLNFAYLFVRYLKTN